MNEQEKSLKLAELMGWDTYKDGNDKFRYYYGNVVEPYHNNTNGLAQFAAILLKYPEVMTLFMQAEGCRHEQCCGDVGLHTKPTQANILDEVLRMNGVEL